MPWDKKSFEELRELIKESVKGKSPPTGFPFYIFVYKPDEEAICIKQFNKLVNELKNDGIKTQVIYLGQLLAYLLSELPYLSQKGREIEKDQREELRRELSKILPEKIANALLTGFKNLFEPLTGMRQNTVTIILRSGALFPFARISQILALLEGKTHSTLVVAFPGTVLKAERTILKFLNETEGTYYRAKVLGG